jgi:hypothetical protein
MIAHSSSATSSSTRVGMTGDHARQPQGNETTSYSSVAERELPGRSHPRPFAGCGSCQFPLRVVAVAFLVVRSNRAQPPGLYLPTYLQGSRSGWRPIWPHGVWCQQPAG